MITLHGLNNPATKWNVSGTQKCIAISALLTAAAEQQQLILSC